MGKRYYRFPILSKLARFIANLLPDRVHGWIWLNALDELDQWMEDIHQHNEDGSQEYFSAVSATKVERLRRRVILSHLRATLDGPAP